MPRGGLRFAGACAAGGAIALVPFIWVLSHRPGGFFDVNPLGLGGFYDAQARALLHGHWDAGSLAFSIERIRVGGRYYMYFGPWPSFVRMPVLLVTSSFDGKLTPWSLVAAAGTLFAGIGRLMWRIRQVLERGDPSRGELVAVAAFVVLVGCGSTVVFLGGSAWVYDEAVLWGAAWAVWSLATAIGYLVRPTRPGLVLAALFTTFAVLTRNGSGAIGIVLLGSMFLVQLLDRLRRGWSWPARVAGVDDRLAGRRAWPVGVAALVPVIAYFGVNLAKFGTLTSIPFEKQDVLRSLPTRKAVLAANGSGLVALRELPTNVLQYLRPDSIRFEHAFPFVGFGGVPTNIGGVARDPELPSAGLTATTTLLVVLAIVGILVIVVPWVARRVQLQHARELRLPLVAGAVAFVPALIFPAVAERYKADLTPMFVVAGFVGVLAAGALLRDRPAWRRAAIAGAAVLLVVNVWTNIALTAQFQREQRGGIRTAQARAAPR